MSEPNWDTELERNEVWWRCTDCEIDVSYRNLVRGVRCPYCGGARTIPRPNHAQASPERDDRPRNAAEDAAAERSRASYYGYDDGEN